MNSLKRWVRESREQQSRHPERYLASYPELVMDETHVFMTPDLLEKIESNCGRYDGTIPTGTYLGKMFVRGNTLCWFSIDKKKPMTHCAISARTILIV